jgi:proteasome lid subunit RPN8/RPN11
MPTQTGMVSRLISTKDPNAGRSETENGLFRINISSTVLDGIAADVRRPYERIGLLMGDFLDDGLWINDFVIGGNQDTETSCVLSPQKLAKVADDIIKGKLEGRIVGWYHSHPGYGIFMSETDLNTHSKLLQFSPFVVAVVVDPEINEFGIWALEPDVGIVQVSSEHIKII